jgi:hypothetical protein
LLEAGFLSTKCSLLDGQNANDRRVGQAACLNYVCGESRGTVDAWAWPGAGLAERLKHNAHAAWLLSRNFGQATNQACRAIAVICENKSLIGSEVAMEWMLYR